MEKKKEMNYVSPEVETFELEIEGSILDASGGGINTPEDEQ